MSTKGNRQEEEVPKLPQMAMLLVRTRSGDLKIVDLDDYVTKPDQIKQKFLSAGNEFGYDNVRYCKIVSTRIRTEAEFIEG